MAAARTAEIDVLAITDHQTFKYHAPIAIAAATPGRTLTVLPGIEITASEGVHLLAVFPADFPLEAQTRFLGWLEIDGSGDTRTASTRPTSEILEKIASLDGITVVPHPFSEGIGLLDDARKISTKMGWLESGHIRLIQIKPEQVKFLDRDEDGKWLNRYVLASSRPQDIKTSTYCLAPFNRSDAHKPAEIAAGCSWFKMATPTVDGLRQVACEPGTRIRGEQPVSSSHSRICGMRISGGYCDDQFFRFNEGLNCLVGQNYAGKSSALDFIRYGLGQDAIASSDSRTRLWLRLYGILGAGGAVELFVRKDGQLYVLRRSFTPLVSGTGSTLRIDHVPDKVAVYVLDEQNEQLEPVPAFQFPIEVYEQGRISRLRDDIGRQLEMIDEFAHLDEKKRERSQLIEALTASAERLHPLYQEREELAAELARLPQLETELSEKQKLLPGEEEQKWARAAHEMDSLTAIVHSIETALSTVLNIPPEGLTRRSTELERLFAQRVPPADDGDRVQNDTLKTLRDSVETAVRELAESRRAVIATGRRLVSKANDARAAWKRAKDAHDAETRKQLAQAGVESPAEVLQRVTELRRQLSAAKSVRKPRLNEVTIEIGKEEQQRQRLLERLAQLDEQIFQQRKEKAVELTTSLGGQIRISIDRARDRCVYLRVLNELCDSISGRGRRVQNREAQLQQVVEHLQPLQLADALLKNGICEREGHSEELHEACAITENTADVLCIIARDVRLLNKLQTVPVPDVPQILVRRTGENSYAELRTGLSPGEQSAAILTLALQTRAMPLVVDQPEDELGYSYVVHLIVPKILEAKLTRQLIFVTHNANIPVLGDADFVCQMENLPGGAGGRRCVIANDGCFESADITSALVELDGGKDAFQFRRYRYGLPHTTATPIKARLPFKGEIN